MSTTEDGSSGASRRVQQAPGLWRTDLQQQDLSVPGRESSKRASTSARPHRWSSTPTRRRDHLHPGRVAGVPGRRPATRTYNAGDALTVPAGIIHAVRNVGSGNAAELATYVVEKGKPLITVVD